MSEQLEINNEDMYPKSSKLGYNYLNDRKKIYKHIDCELDELNIGGTSLENFKENLDYFYDDIKTQIEKFLLENNSFNFNHLGLQENTHYCSNCSYDSTEYLFKIVFFRYETEDEFLIRKEKEEKIKEKENKYLKDSIITRLKHNKITKEEIEEILNLKEQ